MWLSYSDGNNSVFIGIGHRRDEGDAISKRHRTSEAKQSTSFMRARRLAIEAYVATRPLSPTAVHNGVQKQLPRPRCFQEASSIDSWFDCSATPAPPKRPVALRHPARDQGASRSSPLDRLLEETQVHHRAFRPPSAAEE